MVGAPIGNEAFAVNSALEIVRDGGIEQLARILPRMPDKQSANLIVTSPMVHRTSYIERVMDPELSLPACQRADTSAMWMLERLLELPGTADESSVFEDGCPAKRLTLQPHQISQAILSTGTGGFGLSSPESRRMSASIGSLVATVPEVLADLSGPLGGNGWRELPNSDLVRRIWSSDRDLRDIHGVSEEAMAKVVPESWRNREFRENEERASWQPDVEVMTAKRSASTRRSTCWGST